MYDQDPREIASPLAFQPAGDSPIKPKPVVATFSGGGDAMVPPAADSAARSIPTERLWPDGRPATRNTDHAPVLAAIAGHPSLLAFATRLAAKPRGKRDGAVRSCEFWLNYLTGVERGRFVKATMPELCDQEVAALADVARERLVKDPGYQELKRLLASRAPASPGKYRGRVRRRIEPTRDADGAGEQNNRDVSVPR